MGSHTKYEVQKLQKTPSCWSSRFWWDKPYVVIFLFFPPSLSLSRQALLITGYSNAKFYVLLFSHPATVDLEKLCNNSQNVQCI